MAPVCRRTTSWVTCAGFQRPARSTPWCAGSPRSATTTTPTAAPPGRIDRVLRPGGTVLIDDARRCRGAPFHGGADATVAPGATMPGRCVPLDPLTGRLETQRSVYRDGETRHTKHFIRLPTPPEWSRGWKAPASAIPVLGRRGSPAPVGQLGHGGPGHRLSGQRHPVGIRNGACPDGRVSSGTGRREVTSLKSQQPAVRHAVRLDIDVDACHYTGEDRIGLDGVITIVVSTDCPLASKR